ncbi:GNAT family N-acetyltransferase [Vibrio hepatarius]|uniref:GNAT family N-acetyltransferase n=1 Tax=Vibrio hepatarius TaxID=171383 RepID=UPI001C09FDDB|nr:GNAT family N-acetyltransferase [Vibrio hepatarius]MBU2895765.1 GNAT family N-acetyltransferase [Vibrio hepatarius]
MIIATHRTLLVPYNESLQSEFLMLSYCTMNRIQMDDYHTVSSAKPLFQRILHDPTIYALAVLDNHSRDYIGHVCIYRLGESPELGFLFDKAYWGQGIGSEVLKAFLPKALLDLNLRQLVTTVDCNHIPSIRIVEKLGFERLSDSVYPNPACLQYMFTSYEVGAAL